MTTFLQIDFPDREKNQGIDISQNSLFGFKYFSPAKAFVGGERVRALQTVNMSQLGSRSQCSQELNVSVTLV